MEADVLNALESQIVYANGGRDRENHILIVIQVPYTYQQNDTNHLSVVNQKQLDVSIKYLLACFSDETKQSGFVILFDAQKCSWRLAKSCIRYLNQILDKSLENFIVLRQDAFWDNKRVENCAKGYKKGEPNIISKSRLIKFFELGELPDELGGTLSYHHVHWIQNRLRIDEYKKVYDQLTTDYDNFHSTLIDFKLNIITDTKKVPEIYYLRKDEMNKRIKYFIESGKKIIQEITNSAQPPKRVPQDLLDARDKIKSFQNDMKRRENQLYALWIELEKTIDDARELVHLGEGVTFVTNWILGTAEQMFKEQHKVGYDVQTAEELRNQHEQLELQCWDTYGNYAKLLYKINQLNTLNSANMKLHKDLLSQRDFMDFVCRSFASRLERRRNILITSLRFYRLVSEYFDRTNDVFKSLVMGSKVDDHDKACENLRKLKESQYNLDKIEKELTREGEKLSDMLSMPIKDALGREIDIDYSNDIVNVRDILDATIARRNIFVDSLELQKLTLEQITHIHIYEKDAETTIKWIEDLYKVMTKSHTHVGCTVYEIQNQKDELQSFQETAKGTFDYGCQILSAALALRQLCNLSLDRNSEMSGKINKIYRNLQIVSQEQMTRLRVSAVFHRSVEEHCVKLRGLKESVQLLQDITELEEQRQVLKKYLTCREHLMVEIGRMVRLGRLLKSRLKEAFFFEEEKGAESMNSSPSSSHSSTVNSPVDSEPGTSSSTHETGSKNTQSTAVVADQSSGVKNIIPFESNIIASDAISQKLSCVSKLAEELDNVIKDQQLICMDTDDIETIENDKKSDELSTVEDWNSCLKSSKSSMEDDSFITASDVTCTPQSRSSSYHTASECRTSPWWDNDHNSFDADSLDLDSQLPSLNLFNSITLTNMPYVDESDTSLQLLNQRKSPLHGSDSTDVDENHKKVLLTSSSSNDELSTDSLSCSKELKRVNGLQNHNDNSDSEILDLPLDPNNNAASQEQCFTTKAEIHATDTDAQHYNHQVRMESVPGKLSPNPSDLNSSVWHSYYQNLVAKQALIKGCF